MDAAFGRYQAVDRGSFQPELTYGIRLPRSSCSPSPSTGHLTQIPAASLDMSKRVTFQTLELTLRHAPACKERGLPKEQANQGLGFVGFFSKICGIAAI